MQSQKHCLHLTSSSCSAWDVPHGFKSWEAQRQLSLCPMTESVPKRSSKEAMWNRWKVVYGILRNSMFMASARCWPNSAPQSSYLTRENCPNSVWGLPSHVWLLEDVLSCVNTVIRHLKIEHHPFFLDDCFYKDLHKMCGHFPACHVWWLEGHYDSLLLTTINHH